MITIDQLCRQVTGLRTETLRRWIANDWIRPAGGSEEAPDVYLFEEIDIARVRLIVTLREEMQVDEEALPIVLSLLDQLHDTRRYIYRLQKAIDEAVPSEARRQLQDRLRGRIVEPD